MNYFSQNLQALRKAKSLNQSELADALGLKKNTISNYENKVSQPDIETLISFSNFFGVTLTNLVEMDISELGEVPEVDTSLPEAINDLDGIQQNISALKKKLKAIHAKKVAE